MEWFKCALANAGQNGPSERLAVVTIDRAIGSDWSPDWINDLIGETAARDFIDAIEGLGKIDRIELTLNSPGGDVASGVRIYNYLKNHPAKVDVRVDGMAASIASVIMMAGDTRTMGVGSTVMVHNPMIFAEGFYQEAELRQLAESMGVIKSAIVDAYVAGTSKDAKAISDLLNQGNTYLGAEDAIEWGFATAQDATLKAVARLDIEAINSQIAAGAKIRELENQVEIDCANFVNLQKSHDAAAAERDEALEALATLKAAANPPPATPDEIIAICESHGVSAIALDLIKAKSTKNAVEKKAAFAAGVADIASAAGIDIDSLVQHLDDPIALMRTALAEAKAESQFDIVGTLTPEQGKAKSPVSSQVYSQLNRHNGGPK